MSTEENVIVIGPQAGPQTTFAECEADIAFYGGAAGGGKTWALLYAPLRHLENPKFSGVIFRKTLADIKKEGGLLDQSRAMYIPITGGSKCLNESSLQWSFPQGMSIQLGQLQYESNKYDWQGAQLTYIGFDELTHFSETQFFYLLSRNRSMSGVPGFIRATCNPDADSWVARFIEWWIDQETGYAIKERSGVVRYFLRAPDDTFIWGNTSEECIENYSRLYNKPDEKNNPKSFTFICATLDDNQILMTKDPEYVSNLYQQTQVDRERLLRGNWKIKATAGRFFKKTWFEIVDDIPPGVMWIRYWDRAATEEDEDNDPDFTVGMKIGRDRNGIFYIADIRRFREGPFKVQENIQNTASQDSIACEIWLEHDPGQAGKVEVAHYVRALAGYTVKINPVPRTNKELRAKPASAQAEHGMIKLVRGDWNESFLNECANFPKGYKDQVDCLSGGVQVLCEKMTGTFSDEMVRKGGTIKKKSDTNW